MSRRSQNITGGSGRKHRSRSKRINIMKSALDKAVSDFRDENSMYEVALFSINRLASYVGLTRNGFRNWNPELILPSEYESVEYIRQKGIQVEWEEYIEERKEERKKKAEENRKKNNES